MKARIWRDLSATTEVFRCVVFPYDREAEKGFGMGEEPGVPRRHGPPPPRDGRKPRAPFRRADHLTFTLTFAYSSSLG